MGKQMQRFADCLGDEHSVKRILMMAGKLGQGDDMIRMSGKRQKVVNWQLRDDSF